jgi:hypothetical protein
MDHHLDQVDLQVVLGSSGSSGSAGTSGSSGISPSVDPLTELVITGTQDSANKYIHYHHNLVLVANICFLLMVNY